MQEYEYEYAEFIYYTPGYLDKEAQIHSSGRGEV